MKALLTDAPALLHDEARLMAQIDAGDAVALEQLIRRHNRMLYRVARGIVRDDIEAEDCVQDAYVQACRSLRAFRGESRLSTWLTRIVINVALQRLRSRRARGEDVPMENVVDIEQHVRGELTQPEQPETALWRTELRRALEREIDQLPLAFRTVFLLRAVQELSVDETAACLDIPPATVRTRFFRARGLLRDALERGMEEAIADTFAFDGERCDRIVLRVLARVREDLVLHRG